MVTGGSNRIPVALGRCWPAPSPWHEASLGIPGCPEPPTCGPGAGPSRAFSASWGPGSSRCHCLLLKMWACTDLGGPQGDPTVTGVGQEAGKVVQPASATSRGSLGTQSPPPRTLDWQPVALPGNGGFPSNPSCVGKKGTPGTGPKPQAQVRAPWGTQPLTGPLSATCRVEG